MTLVVTLTRVLIADTNNIELVDFPFSMSPKNNNNIILILALNIVMMLQRLYL